MACEN